MKRRIIKVIPQRLIDALRNGKTIRMISKETRIPYLVIRRTIIRRIPRTEYKILILENRRRARGWI